MFYSVRDLPKLNLEHQAARQWMIDAARYWLEVGGLDGYRLDHAAGPSHNFWIDFRQATRATAPESFTVGEVVDSADVLRSYTGRLDGVLDFLFLDAARRFFAFESLDAAGFDAFLHRHDAYFGPNIVRPSFLDNHDMNRFLFTVGDDKARLRLASLCQFTLPQPPIVYYGTEVGMSQARDKRNRGGQGDAEVRRPMWWDNRQDRHLLAYFQSLYRLRAAHPALRRGERTTLYADSATNTLAYAMQYEGDTVMVALNNSREAHEMTLEGQFSKLPYKNALDSQMHQPDAEGNLHLRLPPRDGVVLAPIE
jgi:glycosidase